MQLLDSIQSPAWSRVMTWIKANSNESQNHNIDIHYIVIDKTHTKEKRYNKRTLKPVSESAAESAAPKPVGSSPG